MKPISTLSGERGKGSIRGLRQVVAVVALGGLTLIARPREAPPGADWVWPLRPGAVVRAPGVLTWEGRVRSFDRCLVPASSKAIDPGFVRPAPEVDPGMIVPPAVIGLPVAPANPRPQGP
jgi:hypothetical protein